MTVNIIAVSGDLSENGMGTKASTMTVSDQDWLRIDEYQTLNKTVFYLFNSNISTTNLRPRIEALEQQLRSVFTSKYHYRSTWRAVEPPKANVPAAAPNEKRRVGRPGNKTREAFAAITATPQNVLEVMARYGVSMSVLRQPGRWDPNYSTSAVRIVLDQATGQQVIYRVPRQGGQRAA